MSQIVDNALALRVLSMLVKPFSETAAYKLGIIDAKGNNLIPIAKLTTQEQKEAYNYLYRLVFNLKKIINRLPGGEQRTKNLVAAMFLLRETYAKHSTEVEAPLLEKVLTRLAEDATFVEDELLVDEFLELNEMMANHVGPATATDQAVVRRRPKRRFAGFVVNDNVFNRFAKGKRKFSRWDTHLNLQDDGERMIYDFARKNPRGVIVLHNGKRARAIRFNRKGGGSWGNIKRSPKVKV